MDAPRARAACGSSSAFFVARGRVSRSAAVARDAPAGVLAALGRVLPRRGRTSCSPGDSGGGSRSAAPWRWCIACRRSTTYARVLAMALAQAPVRYPRLRRDAEPAPGSVLRAAAALPALAARPRCCSRGRCSGAERSLRRRLYCALASVASQRRTSRRPARSARGRAALPERARDEVTREIRDPAAQAALPPRVAAPRRPATSSGLNVACRVAPLRNALYRMGRASSGLRRLDPAGAAARPAREQRRCSARAGARRAGGRAASSRRSPRVGRRVPGGRAHAPSSAAAPRAPAARAARWPRRCRRAVRGPRAASRSGSSRPGKAYEQYSNGLRIDTTLRGRRRAAPLPRLHVAGPAWAGEATTKPVGILFHTSESDVWPLEAGFNENLRGSSQRLLRYVQREQASTTT